MTKSPNYNEDGTPRYGSTDDECCAARRWTWIAVIACHCCWFNLHIWDILSTWQHNHFVFVQTWVPPSKMGHDDGSLEKPWPSQRIEPKELRLASTARALTASLVRTVPALSGGCVVHNMLRRLPEDFGLKPGAANILGNSKEACCDAPWMTLQNAGPDVMQIHAIHVRSKPGLECQSKKVDFTSKGLIFSNAPPKSSISINFNVLLGGEKYQKYQGFWLLRPWYGCFRGSYATFALL